MKKIDTEICQKLSAYADPNSPELMRSEAGIILRSKHLIKVRSEFPKLIKKKSYKMIEAETRVTIGRLFRNTMKLAAAISELSMNGTKNLEKIIFWSLSAIKGSHLIEGSLNTHDAQEISDQINYNSDNNEITILRIAIRNHILRSANIDLGTKKLIRNDKESLSGLTERKAMEIIYEKATAGFKQNSLENNFYYRLLKAEDFDPSLNMGPEKRKLRLRGFLTDYLNYSNYVIRHKIFTVDIIDIFISGILKYLGPPCNLTNEKFQTLSVSYQEELIKRRSPILSGALALNESRTKKNEE